MASEMAETLRIDPRFHGPPSTGNGGYTAGRLAQLLSGTVVVRLSVPPPLDRDLTVEREDGEVLLRDGDVLVARARRGVVDVEPPPSPGFEAARYAARDYLGFRAHAFPSCFVCGPERAAGDGLRIFAGPVPGCDLVAAPWTPDRALADERGTVQPWFVWAALDCPGAYAADRPPEVALVLGELTARLDRPVHAGERCVVLGWPLGRAGRKHHVATAIYGGDGSCRAVAQATWFELEGSR